MYTSVRLYISRTSSEHGEHAKLLKIGTGRPGTAIANMGGTTMTKRRRQSLIPKTSGTFSPFTTRRPVAGVDYPRDRTELERMLHTEGGALRLLERVRWPHGFSCGACGSSDEPWRSGTGLLACRRCREHVQLTRESIFYSAVLSVPDWLRLMWEVAGRESACQVEACMLDMGWEARPAHMQVAKLRSAMVVPSLHALSGRVEVGRACIELAAQGDGGCWMRRATVAIAIKRPADGVAEQIRLRLLESDAFEELLTFNGEVIAAGSEIHTTKWHGFDCLPHMGFVHCPDASKGSTKLHGSSSEAERIASALELWLWGQGQLALGGAQQYLDELSFRYNRRDMATGRMFYDLVMAGLLHRAAQRAIERAANG